VVETERSAGSSRQPAILLASCVVIFICVLTVSLVLFARRCRTKEKQVRYSVEDSTGLLSVTIILVKWTGHFYSSVILHFRYIFGKTIIIHNEVVCRCRAGCAVVGRRRRRPEHPLRASWDSPRRLQLGPRDRKRKSPRDVIIACAFNPTHRSDPTHFVSFQAAVRCTEPTWIVHACNFLADNTWLPCYTTSKQGLAYISLRPCPMVGALSSATIHSSVRPFQAFIRSTAVVTTKQ